MKSNIQNMHLTIKLTAVLGMTLLFSTQCFSQRPNIVYIMSDDHAYQAISAYGGPLKKYAPTPNIDRIANNGMLFNRCLVTNSICGPSRATILTGKYSHLNGYLQNEVQEPFDASQQTFPKLLQQAGYSTAIIGKWHLESNPTGFNYWDILPGQGNYYNPDFIKADGTHKEKGYVTEIITAKSIQWLKETKESGKPFMLMMYHKAPHRNWQPGPNELTLYKNTQFPEPPTLFDDYSNRGTAEGAQDMTIAKTMRIEEDVKMYADKSKIKNTTLRSLDPKQLAAWDEVYDPIINEFKKKNPTGDDLVRFKYQRYLQDYLACIAGVDKSVGEVLDFLKENGMDKNTIVIYSSDQGFYLGEHGWFDKRWMLEQSYRTPLLIQWPGIIKPGSVNNDMVSNLDFAETFLDIAGVKKPSDMQGESMVPLLEGKINGWKRESVYYHYYEFPSVHMVKRHYAIVTKAYKLIHFYHDVNEWELIDRQNDPQELKNEYNNPKYADVVEKLKKELVAIRQKYGDSEEISKNIQDRYLKAINK